MDKLLHHGHHKHGETQPGQAGKGGKEGAEETGNQGESELQKVKDYVKEDVKEEQEGNTYGGLM